MFVKMPDTIYCQQTMIQISDPTLSRVPATHPVRFDGTQLHRPELLTKRTLTAKRAPSHCSKQSVPQPVRIIIPEEELGDGILPSGVGKPQYRMITVDTGEV
jgi:hypothetical protein